MAGELAHIDVGNQLTKGEWEGDNTHTLDGGANGDLLYFDGINIKRIPIGTLGHVLTSFGTPVPTWRPAGAPPARSLVVLINTSPYTVVATDETFFLVDSTIGPLAIDLPTSIGLGGIVYHFKKISADSNLVTIDGFGAQTVDGDPTITFDLLNVGFDLRSDDANWKVM